MATTCKLIAKTTLGSAANSIDFQSIPATYTDLWLQVSARADFNTFWRYAAATMTFNNSGGTAYSDRRITGDGVNPGSFSSSGASSVGVLVSGSSATASTFSSTSIYIPNYRGDANKSASAEAVTESNHTDGVIVLYAYLWANTAAIDRITLTAGSGNFVTNSSAYLYGILKA